MKWRLAGFILAFLAFAAAAGRVALHSWRQARESTEEGVVTVRLAHWYLEPGMREAFAALLRDYERVQAARGRRVRMEQAPIPRAVYASWSKTQLIGGTAPEIMLTMNGTDDFLAAAYFRPIRDLIEQPNPYNAGTSQEGVRWRDTFLDGMTVSGFNFTLLDHYSVPFTIATTRLFVNRRLLEEILSRPESAALRSGLGESGLPATYAQFVAVCQAAQAYAREKNRPLTAMAGSGEVWGAPLQLLTSRAFPGVTQTALETVAPYGDLRPDYGMMIATGWSYDRPEVRRGLELMREISDFYPRGFLQLRGDDALFQFAQGRALLLPAGSAHVSSIEAQVGGRFPVDVIAFPTPGPEHPRYGVGVLGPITEIDSAPAGFLGLVRGDRLANEVAIDFLRYFTSQTVNARFAELSRTLPAVVDAPVPEPLRALQPSKEGYPRGLDLRLMNGEINRAVTNELYRLFDPQGGVDAFLQSLAAALPEARQAARRTQERDAFQGIARQDTALTANRWLSENGSAEARSRLGFDLDTQQAREIAWLKTKLGRHRR